MKRLNECNVLLLWTSHIKDALSVNDYSVIVNTADFIYPIHIFIVDSKKEQLAKGDFYIKNREVKIVDEEIVVSNRIIATTDQYYNLPNVSNNFRERFVLNYNNRHTITKVFVEYEYIITNQDFSQHPVRLDGYLKLSLNKNNCIIIKKMKDCYAINDVITYIKKFNAEHSDLYSDQLDAWIKKNIK
jgi:hypothetical protein